MDLEQITEDLRTITALLKQAESTPNGWNTWANHVLITLEALQKQMETVPSVHTCQAMQKQHDYVIAQLEQGEKKLDQLEDSLAEFKEAQAVIRTIQQEKASTKDVALLANDLKHRAGLIGILAGAVPAIIVILWHYFLN